MGREARWVRKVSPERRAAASGPVFVMYPDVCHVHRFGHARTQRRTQDI